MSKITDDEHRCIQALRKRGFVVCLWHPEEIAQIGVDPRAFQDEVINRGNHLLHDEDEEDDT